jgi:hypothetical protein
VIAQETFSDFKSSFYSKVKDFSLFDVEDFNLLKVVLDGLFVNYRKRGSFKDSFTKKKTVLECERFVKRLRADGKKEKSYVERLRDFSGRTLVGFSSRVVFDERDKPHSLYFSEIIETLGRENVVFFSIGEQFNGLDFDFSYNQLSRWLDLQPDSEKCDRLRKQLNSCFESILASGIFSTGEIENIKMAVEVFYSSFRNWERIFALLKPAKIIFQQHYHREGMIYAAKSAGIHLVEVQHGLIAKEDVFYVFPVETSAVISKCLFADEILVYGKYWKSVLESGVEYLPEQVKVAGYFIKQIKIQNETHKELIRTFKGEAKLLLVTTQTNLSAVFISYLKKCIDWLGTKNEKWKIVVKAHPNEDVGLYEEIKCESVMVMNHNLDLLFEYANAQLSIYSTTLYDGLRYGIPGFSLLHKPSEDYINSLISNGVSKLVKNDENIFHFIENDTTERVVDPSFFYEPINLSLINKLSEKNK